MATGFSLTGGSLFNPPKTTSTFGFGSSNQNKAIGVAKPIGFAAPSTSTTTFGFGATQSNPSSNFSFGSNQAQSSAGSFGFGNTSTTSSGLFGNTQTSSTGLFGSTNTPTQSCGLFGSTNTPTQSGGLFGNTNTPTQSGGLFGSTTGLFGAKTTASSTGFGLGSGGLFSAPKTTASTFGFGSTFKGFGQPSTQQAQPFQANIQQQGIDPNVALYLAVCAPSYFNDERDEVLKKWNQMQAVWGTGKGYYAQNMPPIEFTQDNTFCRFKAVGYIKLPNYVPEDGFVELVFSKKESEIKAHQQQIVDALMKIFDNNQVCVDFVLPFGETKTRMCIYVQQRSPNGETKKVQSWLVHNHFYSPNVKTQVQNLCIESVTALVALSESQLKDYLNTPPRGIDPMIWEQGKRSCPDSKKFLPVPIVGFEELTARFKAQEEESTLLQGQLDATATEISELQSKMSKLVSNLQERKRRQIQMSHRVLKLIIRQEVSRKMGVPIEQREEHLRVLLESLHSQLFSPTQYMGRLNEILSQISIQPGFSSSIISGKINDQVATTQNSAKNVETTRYSLDCESEKDLQQFLAWEQEAIKELVTIIKKDSDLANNCLKENK